METSVMSEHHGPTAFCTPPTGWSRHPRCALTESNPDLLGPRATPSPEPPGPGCPLLFRKLCFFCSKGSSGPVLPGLRARASTLSACPPARQPRIGILPCLPGRLAGSNSGVWPCPWSSDSAQLPASWGSASHPSAQPVVRGQPGCGGGGPMRRESAAATPPSCCVFSLGVATSWKVTVRKGSLRGQGGLCREAPVPSGSACVAAAGVSPPAQRPAAPSRPGAGSLVPRRLARSGVWSH